MPDENNPTITIDYSADSDWPPTNWTSLLPYAKEFRINNAGLFKVPYATLVLNNRGGRYTGGGAFVIQPYKYLRITADVRGTPDTIFYGRIFLPKTEGEKKVERLTVTARAFTKTLLRNTITRNFLDEQNKGTYDRTLQDVISYMLTHADGDYLTGIALATDNGVINTLKAKHNFDRETLLDAINKCLDYAGYAGCEKIIGGDPTCYVRPYGTDLANPTITLGQDADNNGYKVIERSLENGNIEDLYNVIFPWAGPQVVYPDSDRLTENGVYKGYWDAILNVQLSDESIGRIGNNCVKLHFVNTDPNHSHTIADLDLTHIWPSGLSLQTLRLTRLIFDAYGVDVSGNAVLNLHVILYDDATPQHFMIWACGLHSCVAGTDKWATYQLPLGEIRNGVWVPAPKSQDPAITDDQEYISNGLGRWQVPENPYTYPFSNTIKRIRFKTFAADARFDGMHFEGAIITNPILDSSLVSSDAASIAAYGRSVMHYEEPAMRDYDAIHALAEVINGTTKNPLKKLALTCGAKTWINPNEYLTVNMPMYGITNEQWRIVELDHAWQSSTKLLRTTLQLTPRYAAIASREWCLGKLEGILKNMMW